LNALHDEGAYLSDCGSWERSGYHIVLFYVQLSDRGPRPVPYRLDDFRLYTADGRWESALHLRGLVPDPTAYFPESGTVEPAAGSQVANSRPPVIGFVAFDAMASPPALFVDVADQEPLVVRFVPAA